MIPSRSLLHALVVLSLVASGAVPGTSAQETAPAAPATGWRLVKTIPVGGEGRWDYLCVDAAAHRLYIPRSTHLQVVDLDKDRLVGDIPGTSGVHGVALAPDQGLGFSSNGRDNSVTVFDLATLKVSRKIKTGRNPDAIIYDPASKHILAMNHTGGDITVIDPAALDKESVTIPIGGTLEFAVADGAGQVFVAVEDKSEVVQIDSKANRVLAHWPLAPGAEPTGLALDAEHHRLFAGCGNQKLIVLDSQTGKVLATPEIGNGVDGVIYDSASGAALSANGRDGTVSVVQETAPGKFATVTTPKTLSGARTITWDSKTHQALLPCHVPDGKGGQTFGIAVVGQEEKKD